MSQPLPLEVSDELLESLRRQAEAAGTSPERLAVASLEQQFIRPPSEGRTRGEEARGKFRRGFGSIDLGAPIGSDNERIDADLAGEYGDDHEDN